MKINTVRLRILLGVLSMILPWIVAILYGAIPGSISATYYAAQCITPFMIILGAASILLISYRGYTKLDDIILTCAGICGLLICLCPCTNYTFAAVGTFMLPPALSGAIHNGAAIVFFILLSYNSLFQFTKTAAEQPSKQKTCRNRIFRICGIGMITSFLIIVILSLFKVNNAIWIGELLALNFFGISWLTKANCYKWLFAD